MQGSFGGYTGLFCGYIGLFCGYTGLFWRGPFSPSLSPSVPASLLAVLSNMQSFFGGALHIRTKRALHIRKRALYILKRAIYIRQKSLAYPQNSPGGALHMQRVSVCGVADRDIPAILLCCGYAGLFYIFVRCTYTGKAAQGSFADMQGSFGGYAGLFWRMYRALLRICRASLRICRALLADI